MLARACLSAREGIAFLASLLAAIALTMAAGAGLTVQAFGPLARGY